VLLAALLVAAGASAQKMEPKPKLPPETRPPGEPFKFFFYKNDVPYAGKEIWKLSLAVGQEMPVCVQALDIDGRDTGACPTGWKAEEKIVSVIPVPGKCNAVIIKGLKPSDTAALIVLYMGAKNNIIEASLKGSITKRAPPAKSAAPQTTKPNQSDSKPK
jgi:hypothetical protein